MFALSESGWVTLAIGLVGSPTLGIVIKLLWDNKNLGRQNTLQHLENKEATRGLINELRVELVAAERVRGHRFDRIETTLDDIRGWQIDHLRDHRADRSMV